MIELDELKTFIKFTKPGQTDDDDDLSAILEAAVQHVEMMCGSVAAAVVEETLTVRNGYLILSQDAAGPVAVTANGAPLDTSIWTATDYGFSGASYAGTVRVSYSVGAVNWPEWVRLAVLNWAKYLWQSRLGPRDAARAADAKRTAEDLMRHHLIHPRV